MNNYQVIDFSFIFYVILTYPEILFIPNVFSFIGAVTSKETHDRDGVSEAVTSPGKMRAVTSKDTDDRDGVGEARL